MIRINLLPWREQLREQQKKEFFVILGASVLLVVLVMGVIYLLLAIRTNEQSNSNQFLRDETAKLEIKIAEVLELKKKKAELISQMSVISQLEVQRLDVVHEFSELVKVMPKGIYLTEIDKNGDKFTLAGKAESNMRVSELMRNIDASPWFQDPVLTEIKTNEEANALLERDFHIDVETEVPPDANAPLTPVVIPGPNNAKK